MVGFGIMLSETILTIETKKKPFSPGGGGRFLIHPFRKGLSLITRMSRILFVDSMARRRQDNPKEKQNSVCHFVQPDITTIYGDHTR